MNSIPLHTLRRPVSSPLSLLLNRLSLCISCFMLLFNFMVNILPVGIRAPIAEGSDCALVVTGAYDRRVRLWDIGATALVGGRSKLLGTLSSKVRTNENTNSKISRATLEQISEFCTQLPHRKAHKRDGLSYIPLLPKTDIDLNACLGHRT